MIITDSHITLNSKEVLNKFCEPLFQNTEISCFEYVWHGKDGYGFVVNTVSPTLSKQYITQNTYPTIFELETFLSFTNYVYVDEEFDGGFFSNASKKWDLNIQIQKPYSILERFYIIQDFKTHFKLYAFSAGQNRKNSLAYYMENLRLLEIFIKYFNDIAKEMLKDFENQRVIFNLDFNIDSQKNSFLNKKNNAFDEFYQYIENHYVNNNNKKIHITNAEKKCLALISKGMTSKETAKELNISHRTVEQHIASLKIKLKCRNSKELIILHNNEEFNLI